MARKVQVLFNGAVIGTRTTDRVYTHALVLTDYNPDVSRRIAAAEVPAWAAEDARTWAWLTMMATTPVGTVPTETRVQYGRTVPAWQWPVTQDDHDKAVANLAGASVEQYQARRRAERDAQLEGHIERALAAGSTVLSYCGRHDLALKAQAQAAKDHPEYTVRIAEVEEVSTKRKAA